MSNQKFKCKSQIVSLRAFTMKDSNLKFKYSRKHSGEIFCNKRLLGRCFVFDDDKVLSKKSFNYKIKKFGFIKSEKGNYKIFFHSSEVVADCDASKRVKVGERVEYTLCITPKNMAKARNVSRPGGKSFERAVSDSKALNKATSLPEKPFDISSKTFKKEKTALRKNTPPTWGDGTRMLSSAPQSRMGLKININTKEYLVTGVTYHESVKNKDCKEMECCYYPYATLWGDNKKPLFDVWKGEGGYYLHSDH